MAFWPPETPSSIDPLKYTRVFTVNANTTQITYWLSIKFYRYLIFMNTIFFINNLFTTFSDIVCQASSLDLKYTHENDWDIYISFVRWKTLNILFILLQNSHCKIKRWLSLKYRTNELHVYDWPREKIQQWEKSLVKTL